MITEYRNICGTREVFKWIIPVYFLVFRKKYPLFPNFLVTMDPLNNGMNL